MSNWSNRILILLGAIGIFITGTLSYTTLRKLDIPCGGHLGCAIVQDSEFATIPLKTGIPVAYIGLAGYLLLFAIAVVRSSLSGSTHRKLAVTGFVMSSAGLLFSLYLTFVSIAYIGQKCDWCLASLAVIVLTTIGHAALLQADVPDKSDSRPGWMVGAATFALAIGALGVRVQGLNEAIDLGGMLIKADKHELSEVLPIEAKTTGDKDARVTLVEFADMNCPACRTSYPEVKKVLAKYGSRIRFAYRHLPLMDKPGHETSLDAAAIAEFAADKGLFWKFVDNMMLPANKDRIQAIDGVLAVAAESGLDRKEIATMLNARTGDLKERADSLYGRIQLDIDMASDLLVSETPTLILYADGAKPKAIRPSQLESELNSSPYKELLSGK